LAALNKFPTHDNLYHKRKLLITPKNGLLLYKLKRIYKYTYNRYTYRYTYI